jgi:hypothetical protein
VAIESATLHKEMVINPYCDLIDFKQENASENIMRGGMPGMT